MSITKYHDAIFDYLLQYQDNHKGFYFLPRRREDQRLSNGYWFLGNELYLAVTFWAGNDTANKTANISFIVLSSKNPRKKIRESNSFLQLTARDDPEKSKFLHEMSKEIEGVKPFRVKGELFKPYESINPLKNLEKFLSEDKPIIDRAIGERDVNGLSMLTSDSLKYIERIKKLRSGRI